MESLMILFLDEEGLMQTSSDVFVLFIVLASVKVHRHQHLEVAFVLEQR